MPDTRTEAIKTHVSRFREARKKMMALPDQVDAKIMAIRQNEELTPSRSRFGRSASGRRRWRPGAS